MMNNAAEAASSFGCSCDEQVPTKRTLSNGRLAAWLQCVKCGRGIRAVRAAEYANDINELPPYDGERYERHMKEWAGRYRDELAAAREQQSTEWWERYTAYLASPRWRRLRDAVLKRDGHRCQACLTRRASQVHHLDYNLFNTVGASAAFECVAICEACHAKIHPRLNEVAA